MIEEMRSSYPDISQAPPRIRALIEKHDKKRGQNWAMDFSLQGERLKKARQAVDEIKIAQEQHRQEWLTHLKESVTQWKDMLTSYTSQRDHYHNLMENAKQELENANTAIGHLSAQAKLDGKSVPSDAEATVATPVREKDEQEEALREMVQKTLQQCIDLTGEDEVTMLDDGEGQPRAKRSRSADAAAVDGSS